MMPSSYIALDHTERSIDLDAVIDVVRGMSGRRPGWLSLVVYEPETDIFVELRDAPPDVRGNSRDEAEEITDEYLTSAYGVSKDAIEQLRSSPKAWRFIDLRKGL